MQIISKKGFTVQIGVTLSRHDGAQSSINPCRAIRNQCASHTALNSNTSPNAQDSVDRNAFMEVQCSYG